MTGMHYFFRVKKTLVRSFIKHSGPSIRCFHVSSQRTRSAPITFREKNLSDDFQYFSTKFQDMMETEQFEYFKNMIRKVQNINHPVSDFMSTSVYSPVIDLITDSITKISNKDFKDEGKNLSDILHRQKSIADAVQLIHVGNLLHQRGVFDLSNLPNHGNDLPADHDLIYGNKVALLAGDFLLATAQMKVTLLRDAVVLKIISSATCDIISSSFIGDFGKDGNPLPFKPGKVPQMRKRDYKETLEPLELFGSSGTAEDEWMLRHTIHRGLLVGKGCRAISFLGGHPQKHQENCFNLGQIFYIASQASEDLLRFDIKSSTEDAKLSLISAPVLFHLRTDVNLHKKILEDAKAPVGIDYGELFTKVQNGPGIEMTRKLLQNLEKKSEKFLNKFTDSEGKENLKNVFNSFK